MHAATSGRWLRRLPWLGVLMVLLYLVSPLLPQGRGPGKGDAPPNPVKGRIPTSYDQISPALLGLESFDAMMAKDKADKDRVMARQMKLLNERYNLEKQVDPKVTMTRGKPI